MSDKSEADRQRDFNTQLQNDKSRTGGDPSAAVPAGGVVMSKASMAEIEARHGTVTGSFLTVSQSRARMAIRVSAEKTAELVIGTSSMLFAKGYLIAITTGQVVYFHTKPGAEQRAANAWLDFQPHVRCSAAQFDFIAGQTLTTAGLPLTKEI